ncbi:AAA family ATPase, partial [Glaesserella parasuis]|nr:AAA family ATPase [Glaesserella parasuis]
SDLKKADIDLHRQILQRFFPKQADTDWQKIAVATALTKRFCLISGGPGTGKTRTVAILLAALQLKQLEQNQPLLKIALAAPTGKAAARLKESISNNLASLDLPDSLKAEVPTRASTIHSLIGINLHSDLPRHHTQNPLHLDLLVVDEASMIDLFILEKLLNALKPDTR